MQALVEIKTDEIAGLWAVPLGKAIVHRAVWCPWGAADGMTVWERREREEICGNAGGRFTSPRGTVAVADAGGRNRLFGQGLGRK